MSTNPDRIPEMEEISHAELNAELIALAQYAGRLNPDTRLCEYAVSGDYAVNPMVS